MVFQVPRQDAGIASGLFILPDDNDRHDTDRHSVVDPSSVPSSPSRKERNNSEPINYARPYPAITANSNLEVVTRSKSLSQSPDPSFSPGSTCVRRASRKSPPKLTDSLEDLSRSVSIITSHSAQSTRASFDSPGATNNPYTLAVNLPDLPPTPPPRSARRPSPPALQPYSKDTMSFRATTPPRISSSSSTSSSPSSLPRTPTSSSFIGHLHTHRPSLTSTTSPLSCSTGSASTCGTWSLAEEAELTEQSSRSTKKVRENRKVKKMRKIAEEERFDVDTPPTLRELFVASMLEVVGENGERVKFGDLIKKRKTIVVFIRHCKLTQIWTGGQYLTSC
jgi:hypothetical protein